MKKQDKKQPKEVDWKRKFPGTESIERSVIGYGLNNADHFGGVVQSLKEEDFPTPSMRFLFKVMARYVISGKKWTVRSIADDIVSIEDKPSSLGDNVVPLLGELIVERAEDGDMDRHIGHLIELRNRRNMLAFLPSVEGALLDPAQDPTLIMDKVKQLQSIGEFVGVENLRKVIHTGSIWSVIEPEIEELKNTPFVGTGFEKLDQNLAWGFVPGVSIICGRPSTGKSTLRTNIQVNLAGQGIGTLTITREQSILAEAFRLMTVYKKIPLMELIKVRDWTERVETKVKKYFKEMEKWPIYMVEPLGTYLTNDIQQEVHEARAVGVDPKVVFVDLFAQLDDVNVSEAQAQIIQQKVFALGALGRRLKIHICLIVQLRRYANETSGKKNNLIDFRELLKGGGGYEERAELILMTDRPSYNNTDADDNSMIVRCIKQKDGPTFEEELDFDPQVLTISESMQFERPQNSPVTAPPSDTFNPIAFLNEEEG